MKPVISVVIPLYNKEKSISRTLRSVLNQTEQRFELIVVNDGSTDNSVSIAQSLIGDGRIINQENAGAGAARNRGVREANMDLIAFLDADDEWHPEFLESILRLKKQFPEADVIGSSYYTQNAEGTLSLPITSSLFSQDWIGIIPNYLETIQVGFPFNQSSFAVSKLALHTAGGFPAGVKYQEDADTWIRLSFKSKIAYINKPLSIYHLEAENRLSNFYKRNVRLFDVTYAVEKLKHYLNSGEIPEAQRQAAIEYIANFILPLAQRHLYYGNTKKARELIISCEGTRKHIIRKYWLLFCAYIPPVILNLLIKFKHNTVNPLFNIRDN
jgi:glycosyltransferase involved in cell wall biosynthesis